MDTKSVKRESIKKFLLECGHYDKGQLVRGAKKRLLFTYDEADEEVYESLKRFASHHKIKIEQTEQFEQLPKPTKEYIEELDEDGVSKLKRINIPGTEDTSHLKELLEQRQKELSAELIEINKLLKFY